MLVFTPWHDEPPHRPGWYDVSLASDVIARAYFDGAAWSAPCNAASCRRTHARARRTPWNLRGSRPLWRGITERSSRWLTTEMSRD